MYIIFMLVFLLNKSVYLINPLKFFKISFKFKNFSLKFYVDKCLKITNKFYFKIKISTQIFNWSAKNLFFVFIFKNKQIFAKINLEKSHCIKCLIEMI